MRQTLYFLRHGQTWFNVFSRLQGWSNSQLTEAGIRSAEESGRRLAQIPFDVVYASDLGRAMETAALFLKAVERALPIHPCPALREIGFGYFEGLDGRSIVDLARAKAMDLGLLRENEPLTERIRIDMCSLLDPYHLAENYTDFQARVVQGVKDILAKHKDAEHLLLFSHGSAIQAALEGLDTAFQADSHVQNSALCQLCHEHGRFWVTAYNVL